jgi:hypothetical protein
MVTFNTNVAETFNSPQHIANLVVALHYSMSHGVHAPCIGKREKTFARKRES